MRRLVLLLALLGVGREAAAQACYSTQGSQEYCNALTPAVRFGFPRYTTALLPTCTTANKGAAAYNTTSGTVQVCSGTSWGDVGPAGSGITTLNTLIAGSQDFAAPAAGFTITSAVSTHTFALSDDLAGLEGLSGTGVAVRTGTSTWTTRSITGTANEITVTDGNGVSAAPTISLPSAITLTGKTLTGGYFTGLTGDDYRSADGTDWQGTAAPPAQAADTAAGTDANLNASPAVAGDTNNGAESGGNVNITAGNAERLNTGNAAGGGVYLYGGTGVGNGNGGIVDIRGGAGSGTGIQGVVALRGSSFLFDNAATPTVGSAGYWAFYPAKWAANHGTFVFHDGTSTTSVVNVQASDTPSDGECPVWHTGGTTTWDSCGGGGGISGLTTGTIPKAASSTSIDDSRLIQTGNDVTAAFGTGTAAAKIGGWLYANATSTAGSTSDGLQHTFGSGIGDYTLPANSLSAAGKGVRITGAVQFTTGATLTVYLMFGSTQIAKVAAINKTTAAVIECTVLRSSGASAQTSFCKALRAEGGYPYNSAVEGAVNADSGWVINETTEDATATIAIQMKYASATDASLVVYKLMTVEAIQ